MRLICPVRIGYPTKVTTIGSHAGLATVVTAYDTANSDPGATIDIASDGNSGVITFHENAGTFALTLAQTTADIWSTTDMIVTIDTTKSLQIAVDEINDSDGAAGSGAGTTAHGYTASIVADSSGSAVNGTIKLTKGSADAANTQISLSSLDFSAVAHTSKTVTSPDGTFSPFTISDETAAASPDGASSSASSGMSTVGAAKAVDAVAEVTEQAAATIDSNGMSVLML